MEQKTFRKREGVSLKKLKAYEMTKNLQLSIRKDEERETEKLSMKRVNTTTNVSKSGMVKRNRNVQPKRYHSTFEDIAEKQNTGQEHHHEAMPSKFKKIPLNNPISTRHSQNIEHLVEQISPKSKCFYKFGLKSYQKTAHKRVFSEVMNIPKQEMNGLMFVGELWNNQMTKKFIKANGVHMSKLKFLQKLRDIKWDKQRKEREKQMDSRQLISSVRQFSQRSQKSIQSFQYLSLLSINHTAFTQESQQQQRTQAGSRKQCRQQEYEKKSNTYRKALNSIRDEIDSQFKRCKDQEYWKKMKGLQKESGEMHKLWEGYFMKTLQIN